jgi:hypothetical protein
MVKILQVDSGFDVFHPEFLIWTSFRAHHALLLTSPKRMCRRTRPLWDREVQATKF